MINFKYFFLRFQAENNFVKIADVLMQISENDVEVYWITKSFYAFPLEIAQEFPKLKELTFKLLKKEDHKLYRFKSNNNTKLKLILISSFIYYICSHLENNNILNSLPLEKWYTSCFAGVLTKLALIRIWDKICGGSRKIVVFVFIVLFNTLWRKNLVENDLKGLLDKIEIVSWSYFSEFCILGSFLSLQFRDNQEFSDQIVHKSIELWQQNKDHNEFIIQRKDK